MPTMYWLERVTKILEGAYGDDLSVLAACYAVAACHRAAFNSNTALEAALSGTHAALWYGGDDQATFMRVMRSMPREECMRVNATISNFLASSAVGTIRFRRGMQTMRDSENWFGTFELQDPPADLVERATNVATRVVGDARWFDIDSQHYPLLEAPDSVLDKIPFGQDPVYVNFGCIESYETRTRLYEYLEGLLQNADDETVRYLTRNYPTQEHLDAAGVELS